VSELSEKVAVGEAGKGLMAQFQLGAIRQSLYHLIELGDEAEARKSLELLDRRELEEAVAHLTTALSLANSILDDCYNGQGGSKNA